MRDSPLVLKVKRLFDKVPLRRKKRRVKGSQLHHFPTAKPPCSTTTEGNKDVSLSGRDVVRQCGFIARDALAADHTDPPADSVGHHTSVDGCQAQRRGLQEERKGLPALSTTDGCFVIAPNGVKSQQVEI